MQHIPKDPIEFFQQWFQAAIDADCPEVNAMSLSTVDADGKPHARMVLLKGIDEQGFQFYTNYQSDKAKQLAANPNAALVFFWPQLGRQIRVEGAVEQLPEAQSLAYFQTRERGSQLGAHASPQSQVIPSREFLEQQVAAVTAEYEDQDIPLPNFWGGYLLTPERMEFWQKGQSRLHDRIVYTRDGRNWAQHRLAP